MSKIKNIVKFSGVFMALVFMSPQFMKPLHFAFMHNDGLHLHDTNKDTYAKPEKECRYCDFEFYHFIPSTAFYKVNEAIDHQYYTKTCLIDSWISSLEFKHCAGRAPPLLQRLLPLKYF